MRRKDRKITDDSIIDKVITGCDTIRLGLSDGKNCYIVPMNFGFIREKEKRIFTMHCAVEGRKLEIIRKNPGSSFEMDSGHELVEGASGCHWGMKYQCVMGTGTVSIAENPEERKKAIDLIMKHYGAETPAAFEYSETVLKQTLILLFEVETISCKIKS